MSWLVGWLLGWLNACLAWSLICKTEAPHEGCALSAVLCVCYVWGFVLMMIWIISLWNRTCDRQICIHFVSLFVCVLCLIMMMCLASVRRHFVEEVWGITELRCLHFVWLLYVCVCDASSPSNTAREAGAKAKSWQHPKVFPGRPRP